MLSTLGKAAVKKWPIYVYVVYKGPNCRKRATYDQKDAHQQSNNYLQ